MPQFDRNEALIRRLRIRDVADLIWDALETEEDQDGPIRDISSFAQAGMLTMDTGLILKLKNGQKFNLTIQEG